MKEILDIIYKSAEQVTQNYFKLTTTYEPSGIVRERVFCYELYHQLRLVLGNNHLLLGRCLTGHLVNFILESGTENK